MSERRVPNRSDPPSPSLIPHAVDAAAALTFHGSSTQGLSGDEAARRLLAVGPNRLPETARRSAFLRFLDQFRNVLVYILAVPTILAIWLGHWLDAIVIVAVVIANAVIGWLQEGRAEQALAAVGRLLASGAVVVRGGTRRAIPAAEVVPGDVVFLESGDRVPADVRLVDVRSLFVDESLLTGESMPVQKSVDAVEGDAPLAERSSMAFSGSIVTGGQALGVVVATGAATELGHIGRLVASVTETTTPFLRRLSRTSQQLTLVILGVAVLTIVAGLVIGQLAFEEVVLAAVGFAVAAIPEGLPAIVTIILAIGVRRMAAHGALIRKLSAVETLGSVSIICTDKTGTLTRNELAARTIVTAGGTFSVEGEGYAPVGAVVDTSGNRVGLPGGALGQLLVAGVLCNDARLREQDGAWLVDGDPVEGALLALASRAGSSPANLREGARRIDILPFESEHRYMATLDSIAGGRVLHVKGAPERLLELCEIELGDTDVRPIDRSAWQRRVDDLAADGLRVLAFASAARSDADPLSRDMIGDGLVLLGLVGFIDSPRMEAQRAVAECRKAGIAVKMITGDHAATALAVGRAVGLDVSAGALTGGDLAALDDAAFAEAAERTGIFARIEPAQKLRLVEALQRGGHAVAMTGDGVNDAPALRRADIGVAMGRKGSDAAREAADMVLVDDNFATIEAAVREGRSVDDNLRKALRYVLPTNAGEALLLIVAILTGTTLPITAVQIIWINFATEITLSLSLAFEPPSAEGMRRGPRPRNDALIGRRQLVRIIVVAVAMALAAGAVFWWALDAGKPIEEARAMAVNAVVAAEIAYLFTTATLWPGADRHPINRVAIMMIAAVVALQLAVTQIAPIARALGMAPLGLSDWGIVGLAGAAVLGVGLVERRLSRRPPADAAGSGTKSARL